SRRWYCESGRVGNRHLTEGSADAEPFLFALTLPLRAHCVRATILDLDQRSRRNP
ncbi:MAG: hypothetical protein HDS89_08220, partial [Bacteroidales bacterium]|nr:hypothetical protein [Bacteroidales bacterium]